MASEGFRATVRTPKTPPEAYAIVVAELNPEDPEVSLLPEDLTAVYDTRDGDHRIQAVIEVTEEPAGHRFLSSSHGRIDEARHRRRHGRRPRWRVD